jgi:hypothetical protein
VNNSDGLIKKGLWLYFLLLVVEGALRKWVAPGMSNVLLVVRDPVVMGIYAVALTSGRFPWRASVLFLGGLAALSYLFATLAGAPPIVVLYGLRVNYFHVPLIFVMATVLDRSDVLKFGRAMLWMTPPIVGMMLMQYRAGAGSWWNVGAGGEMDGQLAGALGKMRPSGPFSFITGPVLWCALATAFVFHGWTRPGVYSRGLLVAATLALVVAVPISISRLLMFSVLVVVMFGCAGLLKSPGRAMALLVPGVLVAATFMSIGDGELTAAFEQRWNDSKGSGVQESIVQRFFDDYTVAYRAVADAPWLGHGVGMGSNVAARFARGSTGFMLAEAEWAKVVLELGPALGFLFLGFRCWLALKLVLAAGGRLMASGDGLPWLLCGACVLPVVSGQWAPPTILGFAVFGAGLVFAALNGEETEDTEAEEETEDTEAGEEGAETESYEADGEEARHA